MRMGTELLARMSRQMECPSAPGSFKSSTMQSGSGSEGTGRGVAPGALVGRHGVAGKLQHVGQLRAQGGIVFDEVNALGHGCLSFGGVHRCRPLQGVALGHKAQARGSDVGLARKARAR